MLTRVQKGSNIYAVYELNDSQLQIDKISFMMINSNQQHNIGLAPITFEEMNGVYYKMLFDVTGKVTLREYIGKHISQEDFRQMLLNLIDTIEQFDEYMIDVNQILLDMDSVYINAIDYSIAFLCIALKGVTQVYRPYEFFRAVVQNSYVNLNMNEVSYFNHIWNITSNENGFSLSNMKAAIQTADKSKKKEVSEQSASNVPNISNVIQNNNNNNNNNNNISKIEQPQEITVTQPKFTPLSQPILDSEPEEQKSSGFLGKLFSFGKGKQSEKKAEKRKSTSTGGLAGLRTKANKTGKGILFENNENQDAAANLQQQFMVQQNPVNLSEQQQFENNLIYQGTTVLKGKSPEYIYPTPQVAPIPQQNILVQTPPQPSTISEAIPETTVLKKQVSEPEIPETTVLKKQVFEPEIPETTVLKKNSYPPKSAPKKTACLIRLQNHSRFFIYKQVFSIGRGMSEIDCAVNDNTNVSRHHADIKQHHGEYFLFVVTRTNETYLNEESLQQGAEKKLSDGDKIRLADEEFEFRIV